MMHERATGRRATFVGALFVVLAPCALNAAVRPEKTLHLSFEDETWLGFSRNGSTVAVDYPEFAPGKRGRGAKIMRCGEAGTVELAGNLDKARGTLRFWYKPLFPKGKDNANYTLFSSGALGKRGGNVLLVWLWKGRIRFDVYCGKRRKYCVVSIDAWQPGVWVHIACTWDNGEGIALWLDGKKVSSQSITWTPVDTNRLIIGDNHQFAEPAGGVIDELVVYNAPLSDEQIAADCRGTLDLPNAPLVVKIEERKVAQSLIFHAGFDNGIDADRAAGNSKALASENAKIAEGFRGNGIRLSRDGFVAYDAAKNILKERGTVSIWLKLDWEPYGNGSPISKVGNKAQGVAHAIFSAYAPENSIGVSLELSNFLNFVWRKGTTKGERRQLWVPVNRQILASTWNQYAVTWDEESRAAVTYLNGMSIRISSTFVAGTEDLARLVLGCLPGEISLDGVADELTIHNYAMSPDQVMEQYERAAGPAVVVLDYAALANTKNSVRIKLMNRRDRPVSADYQVVIRYEHEQAPDMFALSVRVPARTAVIRSFLFSPRTPGLYRISVLQGKRALKCVQCMAVDPTPLRKGRPVFAGEDVRNRTLLEEIDCAQDAGQDKYRDDNDCRVVQSVLGPYREAGTAQGSGFAYRFEPVLNPGNPHWLEIDYPDDTARTFYVAVFQEKDGHVDAKGLDTIGVISGLHHPLTMKMQTKRLLFWPDSKNVMVGCYSYKEYEQQSGPALAGIRLYENKGLLPVRKITRFSTYPERRIGLWQEDPSMLGGSWFNQDSLHDNIDLRFWHTKWTRVIEYLNYSGQNLWNMLVFDYDGDTALGAYPVPQSWRVSKNGRVPGWADVGALMLDRAGVTFFVELHDRAGDTYGLRRMIGEKYTRANDRMSHVSAKGAELVECIGNDNFYTAACNPLHPVVQERYKTLVRLYAEKFGAYKRFGGAHFPTTGVSSLYFHSLAEGYGDATIGAFEKDTHIAIPVDERAPKRYSERYAWLMDNAKEEWISWRAGKIFAFYKELSEILRKGDDSRRLFISLRLGKTSPDLYEQWPLKRADLYQYWRECGVDLQLYANEPGIVICPTTQPNRGRIYGEGRGFRDEYNWRYVNFSPELPNILKRYDERSAMIAYHSNLEVLPRHKTRIPSYWWAFGAWFGRVNGPIHAFSTPLPSEEYVLENMAHVLAASDPQRIVHGWWGSSDNGCISQFATFYAAYRSIPAVPFREVPGADDPVVVRYYHGKGESFVYLVNREYYPVHCHLELSGVNTFVHTQNGSVFKPVRGEAGARLDIDLDPYAVMCLQGDGVVAISGTSFVVPDSVVNGLTGDLRRFRAMIKRKNRDGGNTTVDEMVRKKAEDALAARKYSRLHYLLQSGPVLRLRERYGRRVRS